LFGKLKNEEEIKRRLEHLTDRTLEMACDIQNQLNKFSAKHEAQTERQVPKLRYIFYDFEKI